MGRAVYAHRRGWAPCRRGVFFSRRFPAARYASSYNVVVRNFTLAAYIANVIIGSSAHRDIRIYIMSAHFARILCELLSAMFKLCDFCALSKRLIVGRGMLMLYNIL